jgi:hypothetical protein
MIDYRSDNTGRAAPEILEALMRANQYFRGECRRVFRRRPQARPGRR